MWEDDIWLLAMTFDSREPSRSFFPFKKCHKLLCRTHSGALFYHLRSRIHVDAVSISVWISILFIIKFIDWIKTTTTEDSAPQMFLGMILKQSISIVTIP